MLITPSEVIVLDRFWDDVGFLYKKTKSKLLVASFSTDNHSDDYDRLTNIPLLKVITTYITQTEDKLSDKLGKQPFLGKGWVIYKVRYAFDGKGKSSGLRIIYCRTKGKLLMIYINLKTYCADERELEKEVISRMSKFLG